MSRMLLQACKEEILRLRKRNEIMEAQLDIVEVFAVALGRTPAMRGAAMDVIWEIDRELSYKDHIDEPDEPVSDNVKNVPEHEV